MNNNAECVSFEIDYKKVVQEITDTLYKREKELERELNEEKSAFKYIELNAVLIEIGYLRNCMYGMYEYCKKSVEVKDNE